MHNTFFCEVFQGEVWRRILDAVESRRCSTKRRNPDEGNRNSNSEKRETRNDERETGLSCHRRGAEAAEIARSLPASLSAAPLLYASAVGAERSQ